MLDGVDLDEPGSAKELAMVFMKDRQNKIKTMETFLISKALFASNTENPDDKRNQINEYNKILTEYQDLVNPAKIADRKKFEKSFKQRAKALSNKSMTDLIGNKDLSLGKKPKDGFSKTLATKNWKKVK
jgi:hypothetical protein